MEACQRPTTNGALEDQDLSNGTVDTGHGTWWWHIGLLCVLFVVQFEAVEMALRAYYDPRSGRASIWAPLYDYRHIFFSFCIVFPVALVLFVWPRGKRYLEQLKALGRLSLSISPLFSFLSIQIFYT